MSESENSIGALLTTAKEYIETSVDAVKLAAAEKISLLVSNLVAGTIVAVVFFFFLLFASVAGALAISAWLEAPWAGWLAVACFYLVVGIITWLARERWIRLPVMNHIIQQLFKSKPGHEDDQEP